MLHASFDIFRVSANGAPIWIESANSLDSAKERIQTLGASVPGEYLVFDQKAGNKQLVTVGACSEASHWGVNAGYSHESPRLP